ncbi:class I adenylate-forming enzyme family protein [Methylobacterium sp. ID0610]|uniref:class I adenylate-forming enzyme family protein n=1 Tax=Methylobacterium carpenticola TaxID=3344827 RepID=UPI0036799B32
MLRTDLIAPVPELLRRQAEARGDKTAFSDARGSISYGELEVTTARLAGHLQGFGVQPGDTVGMMLPNSVAWVQGCCATLRAGATSVPISYEAAEPEIAYRLADAGCGTVITTDERAETVLRAAAGRPTRLILVDRGAERRDGIRFADLVGTAPAEAVRDPAAMLDPSFIIYTSGTTGRAKGVKLSQHSMLWVTAACWAPIAGLSAEDVVLSPLPLFHSYALNLSVLSILASGATEHLCEKFSTQETLRMLGEGRFSLMPGVPTMFNYLLQASGPDIAALPGLRLCVSAGAIMPAALNREFEARFGVPLLDGYGITETSTMVTMNWPTGGRVPGSCGLPIPGLAVRIVDAVENRDVPIGQEGELIVRGPNLMLGYHNKADETAAVLREGWYHTGDLARSDLNGFLTITGRLKELVIRGGQNIAPAEIEEAAGLFEGVGDCAVVGIPHDSLGEVPVLFIVVKEGHDFALQELHDHCRQRLSSYKVPEAIHVVDEIPRTGSGKVMRFRLREQLT